MTARVTRQEMLVMSLPLKNQLFSQGKLLYPKTLLLSDLSARQTCSLGHPKERREEEVQQPCSPRAARKVSRLFPRSGDRWSSQSPDRARTRWDQEATALLGERTPPAFLRVDGAAAFPRGAYPASPG